jgi:hypothetical protein
VSTVSRNIDRIDALFDDPNSVANAGLILAGTLIKRLGLEALINEWVRLDPTQPGGAAPGRKVLSMVCAIIAGGTHIDHVDVLRAGSTRRVLPFRVMAPSTIGTFLRAFTFGHVRQLDAVADRALQRAWAFGAGPGSGEPLVIDVDSTIAEVHGHHKQGAAYGYTKQLGYHPLLATRAGTGEIIHARMRKGSAGPELRVRSRCAPIRGSSHGNSSTRWTATECCSRSPSPRTRRDCGRTGGITRSSRTPPLMLLLPMSSTATTLSLNSRSATSKKVPASNTAHQATTPPTRPGSTAPSSPTTCRVGPASSAIPAGRSSTTAPCEPGSSRSQPHS